MTSEAPRLRYLPNTLSPPCISTYDDRKGVIKALEEAIYDALTLMNSQTRLHTFGSDKLYTGNVGISLMYMRLWKQLGRRFDGVHFETLAKRLIPNLREPNLETLHVQVSPWLGGCGAAFVKLLQEIQLDDFKNGPDDTAMTVIRLNLLSALDTYPDPVPHEVLCGYAGLLWALLNLRANHPTQINADLYSDDKIETIVGKIMSAGEEGAESYSTSGLMWELRQKPYLGALHGVAGICTVLLQIPKFLLDPIMPRILDTVKMLCDSTRECNGFLPSRIHVAGFKEKNEIVQICHGSPGLLILLATLRRLRPQEWAACGVFAQTLDMVAEVVWQRGYVLKGLGICHGVSGNAWALLSTGDTKWVGRAVALLLAARNMPPLGDDTRFNLPDHPWSLFEGVAGLVAAWAEAIVLLENCTEDLCLGYPGLGGMGAKGFL
ncbi:hypothetical protein EX30DRAFT_340736 [Ascodesmis nigricans]|uniref:Lanthionine synthetase C family protein n=1 Tax=Ascodesmis nigricans TaxID=341454 RepID=A0A4S2MXT2_9PEZI|nr:hypothetical protein EX30DRAFT_340736 [Ascodesmis nigricans]